MPGTRLQPPVVAQPASPTLAVALLAVSPPTQSPPSVTVSAAAAVDVLFQACAECHYRSRVRFRLILDHGRNYKKTPYDFSYGILS